MSCLISLVTVSAVQAETTFEEIDTFEVNSFPLILAHPYEIVIPDTSVGETILCQIFDADGEVVSFHERLKTAPVQNFRNTTLYRQRIASSAEETRMRFAHKVPNATFRCFYVRD